MVCSFVAVLVFKDFLNLMEEGNNSDKGEIEKSERRKSLSTLGGGGGGGGSDSIRVICRFRPPKESEIEFHGQSTKLENFMIDESRGTVSSDVDFEKKNFTYDKVSFHL